MPHDLCTSWNVFVSFFILAIKLVVTRDLSLKSMNIRSLVNLLGFIDHNSIFLGIKITMSIFCCYKMWLLTIKKLGLKTNHHGVWSLIFKQPYCNNQLGTWIFNLISIFFMFNIHELHRMTMILQPFNSWILISIPIIFLEFKFCLKFNQIRMASLDPSFDSQYKESYQVSIHLFVACVQINHFFKCDFNCPSWHVLKWTYNCIFKIIKLIMICNYC